jgi:hypothetical protein
VPAGGRVRWCFVLVDPMAQELDLDARLKIFTSLRLEMLDEMSLKSQLDAIGQMREERQLK